MGDETTRTGVNKRRVNEAGFFTSTDKQIVTNQAALYATFDVFGELIVWDDIFARNNGAAKLSEINITDDRFQTPFLQLFLFHTEPTTIPADNVTFSMDLTDWSYLLGIIDITTGSWSTQFTVNSQNAAIATIPPATPDKIIYNNSPVVADSRKLWGVVRVNAGFTPAIVDQYRIEIFALPTNE